MKKHISLSIALTLCLLAVGCADSNPIVSGLPEGEAPLSEQLPAQTQDETSAQEQDVVVFEDSYISTISVGTRNVFAIDTDGKLWGWGQNIYNVLRIEAEESLHPVEVFDSVKSVSASGSFVLAVREDDTLWGWGRNQSGQLGLGTNTETENAPVRIMDDVSAVSARGGFSVVLKKDGTLWVSGSNIFGVLGNGTHTSRTINNDSNEFIKVMDDIQSFHAIYGNIIAIDNDNCVWAWGDNRFGYYESLGHITNDAMQSIVDTPCKLMDGVRFARVALGFLYMLKLDGELIEWVSPMEQNTILNNVKYIDAKDWTLAAITEDGSLVCRGLPYTEKDSQNNSMLAENVVYVAVGNQFVSYIDEQSDLYCAGLNFHGLIGNGEKREPTGIPVPDEGYRKTEADFVYPPVKILSGIAY